MRYVNVDNSEQLSKLYCESSMVMQGQVSCTALSAMYNQKGYFILTVCALNMFELMRIRSGKSHFWWKEYLRVIALREAHKKLQELLRPDFKKTA